MSSKIFETQLCIKHYQDKVIKELIALGVSNLSIKVIDNWHYENEKQIMELADIEEYVNKGKIAVIDCKYKDLNCGCNISKLANDCYEFDIWIPTKIESCLDDECLTEQNKYVYDAIILWIKNHIEPYELIFCISGIEMCVEYSNDLNKILDNSSGIIQMICLCNAVAPNVLHFNVNRDVDYMTLRLSS